MALKDWKKFRAEDDEVAIWHNKKREENLVIQHMEDSFDKYLYFVFLDTNTYSGSKLLKTFKTKSTALRYAKAYMKKH